MRSFGGRVSRSQLAACFVMPSPHRSGLTFALRGNLPDRVGMPPNGLGVLILRVLGDVPSATTAELTQALAVRDDLYRADDRVRASLALQ